MTGAYTRQIFSALFAAMVLGMISQKISTTRVSTPVAIPIYTEPNLSVANTVVMADAAILTILLPTRTVLRNLEGSSIRL